MEIVNNIKEKVEEIKSGDIFYDTELKSYYMLTAVGGTYGNYRYSIVGLGCQGCFHSYDMSQLTWDKIIDKLTYKMDRGVFKHYSQSEYIFTLSIESK